MSERTELLKLHDWDELLFGGFYCLHCTPDDEYSLDDPIAWPCPPLREAGVSDDEARELILAHREQVAAEHQAKLDAQKREVQYRADDFNARYAIGTPVVAYPGARPEDVPSATRLVTRTRSEAQVLGGHTDVVWVDGYSACIALTHISPLPTWGGSEEARAARNVPHNPNPLCRDFQPKPEPAAFWCATCRWNKPMHDNEAARAAIAEALKCLPAPTAEESK